MISNETIAKNFSLLSKLMEIHGENPFKIKSYANVVRIIEKYPKAFSELSHNEIASIKGIGEAIAQKILDQIATGRLPLLDKYLNETPKGIVEMLQIKGLGAKKVQTIWKDLGIENLGELLYACNENRLLHYKGFGEKTQENIRQAIEFYQQSQGLFLYAQVDNVAKSIHEELLKTFPSNTFLICGKYREQQEIIEQLEWVTDCSISELKSFTEKKNWTDKGSTEGIGLFSTEENIQISLFIYPKDQLAFQQFERTGSQDFLEAWKKEFPFSEGEVFQTEEEIFQKAGTAIIPPYLRDFPEVIQKAKTNQIPDVIQTKEIKGIIHSHSNWSDGANTLREMAQYVKSLGLEYLVISDHSQSAFYANGLKPDRVLEQHKEIDQLNQELAPFHIFKSIESDILYNGDLDYPDEVLDSFDLIIASVHSILKMDEEKATSRILAAVANPYTSILGHMTGRLLLSRAGYPVDHDKIIKACQENDVVIELNAHPRRLDIDWRWLYRALDNGIITSINPDAHSTEGCHVIQYGVSVGQKAGLTSKQNLSSFSLEEMHAFVAKQKSKRKNNHGQ
ncbi:MAG: histidinol-phosphatase [Pseudopedobacter saltans]|uniref:Histidinol-phosphatase n=1 Tax=Pseudopedobacter saltans TaxID=151895 RepID=A0A2W5F241_9SPHI|nr:MAG: histidinol-phosphatase [Pseudopedobacter saltans]